MITYIVHDRTHTFSVCIVFSVCSELGSEAESSGVMVDVVSHEGGDHVVRMIEQRLHPHMAGIARVGGGSCEVSWFELVVQEPVSSSLVDQDGGLRSRVVLHQLSGVVGLAGLYGPEVAGEGLLPPGHGHGVGDGGEGRDRAVHAGVPEVSHQGSVASHAVASDALPLWVHGEQTLDSRELESLRLL